MGKRGADEQLVKDGQESGSDDEPSGGPSMASSAVLKNRFTMKPKRKKGGASASVGGLFGGVTFGGAPTSTTASSTPSSFVFGAVTPSSQPVTPSSTTSSPFGASTTSSNPFGTTTSSASTPFSFGTSTSNASDSPFGGSTDSKTSPFGSASGSNLSTSFKPTPANDNEDDDEEAEAEKQTQEPPRKIPFGMSSSVTLSTGPNLFSKPTSSFESTPTTQPSASSSGSSETSRLFKKLNDAFIAKLTSEAKADEVVDLSPCLHDYLKHAKNIVSGAHKENKVATSSASSDAQDNNTNNNNAAASTSGSEEINEVPGTTFHSKGKVYFQKHFSDKDKTESVYLQDKIKTNVEQGNDYVSWTARGGKGHFRVVKEEGKKGSVQFRGMDGDKPLFLNVGVSQLEPKHKPGEKDVLIVVVPNPPLGIKCPVCAANYADPRQSNVCKNGCSGAEGCGVVEGKDNIQGHTVSAQPFLLRTPSASVAADLAAQIIAAKD